MKFGLCITALTLLFWVQPKQVQAAERPPDVVRGAPIIRWAKSVGEHRYRSPRAYEGTIKYYKKTMRRGWKVAWKKIINTSSTRAMHIANRNKAKNKDRWEGINIYEHKGATYIYVIYSDQEKQDIKEGKKPSKKKKRKKKKKKTKKKKAKKRTKKK